jgi:hypothetical protein
MNPERPATVHGMPARYLTLKVSKKIGRVGFGASFGWWSGWPRYLPSHLWTGSGLVQDRRALAGPDHLATLGRMLIVVAARPHGNTSHTGSRRALTAKTGTVRVAGIANGSSEGRPTSLVIRAPRVSVGLCT